MPFNVLVVDDEADIRELVSGILEDKGYAATTAGSYVEAYEAIRQRCPNLAIIDVWLGEGERDGLRLLELFKTSYECVPVVMISGHSTIETAVSAVKQGAYDFIEKPFDSARLLTSVEKAIEATKLKMEDTELKKKTKVADGIFGKSRNIQDIRQLVAKIAPLNGRCVILGETGSDKGAIAREIHNLSSRAKNPFKTINCRSFNLMQLEMEFFGVETTNSEGMSFSTGALENAAGGTLFIDELAYTSIEFQQKILKLLRQGSFNRIGASKSICVDVRIIAGLPLDTETLIKAGKFSDELYYRLNSNTVRILPLTQRQEDIPCLIEHYAEEFAQVQNIKPKKFTAEVLSVLTTYPWSGDVMQLKGAIDWILTVVNTRNEDKSIIGIEDLPVDMFENKRLCPDSKIQFISQVSDLPAKEAKRAFETEYYAEQLKRFRGNISQMARFVGMERSALHRKLKTLDIDDSKLFRTYE